MPAADRYVLCPEMRMAPTKSKRSKAKKARNSSSSSTRRPSKSKRRWSRRVSERSDALDLEDGVFKKNDPREIAQSLKRSSQHSNRRKADPFRSAMSMLNFYVNRAGKNLTKTRRSKIDRAKDELRDLFGRERKRTQQQ